MLLLVSGCVSTPAGVDSNGLPIVVANVENPLFVAVADREFLWNQLVDVVDDYFKIEREDRVRVVQDVLVEGRIQTWPKIGATLLEPWRRDSTPGFERLQSTLQTIRRRAHVRVSPADGGYLVEVVVLKELEDPNRSETTSVGGAAQRHDGSLVRADDRPDLSPVARGWIPLGRDISLEQQMLGEIRARLAGVPTMQRLPP